LTLRIAAAWTGQPAELARSYGPITREDQWTGSGEFRDLRPLMKYTWPEGEEVYVSTLNGEVQYTTRGIAAWRVVRRHPALALLYASSPEGRYLEPVGGLGLGDRLGGIAFRSAGGPFCCIRHAECATDFRVGGPACRNLDGRLAAALTLPRILVGYF
jgi:hypothetical protein